MSETPPEQEISPYRRLVEKAFARAIPLAAQFEITYRCNHQCTFCYHAPTGQKEMTTPQIFEVLRKIQESGVLYLTLTGGEPMVHKDFWAIAAEVRRLGMALRVYTNGFLLSDPERVRRLAALRPWEVEVSVHGARPESHEALTRIPGSFARTWTAIGLLHEAGLKINLKCPITRLNQDDLTGVRDLAEAYGLQVTFDPVITPKDDGDLSHMHLRPDEEFMHRYYGELYAQLHRGKLPPRANHCAAGGEAVCGSGRSGFTVDPYGNLLPCVAFRRKVGNLLEIERLEDVWTASPVLRTVRDLAVEARTRLDGLPDGPYFTNFCMGVAELQTGDPLGMYPQAEVNARSVRRAYELLQIGDPPDRKSA